MEQPVVLKILENNPSVGLIVQPDIFTAENLGLKEEGGGPTILLAQNIVEVPQASAIIVDTADLTAVWKGSPAKAILLVRNGQEGNAPAGLPVPGDDERFVSETEEVSEQLALLAREIIKEVRSKGVQGNLERKKSGKWVNAPINCFTLKVQPRVQNIRFTLYGNPESFDDMEFVKRDQNSYSSGLIKNTDDVKRFARLAKKSYASRHK